ncbi:hypothetical protein Peur_059390 [Populus x canadensis]
MEEQQKQSKWKLDRGRYLGASSLLFSLSVLIPVLDGGDLITLANTWTRKTIAIGIPRVSSVTLQNALSRGVGTPGRTNDLLKVNSLKLGGLNIWSLIKLTMYFRLYLKRVLEVILGTLHSSGRACFSLQPMPTWVKKMARKYSENPLQIDLE